jgi:serine/threonine-protein kinase
MLEPEINKSIDDNDHSLNQHENVSDQAAKAVLKSLENSVAQSINLEPLPGPLPFSPSDIIADRYQIVEFISRGNMGLVYKAKDLELKRTVAIKLLSPDKPLDFVSKKRFEREAIVIASLNHPNIVTLYNSGILKNGMLYLDMEYIEGQTLADLLRTNHRLDFHTALPIFMQICEGLEHAHNADIIHRDLKPSNIMLVDKRRGKYTAKVIDFSIAKFTKPKPDQKTITRPGDIFGSPLYMSPEQCQAKVIDQRSDIYSLGCIMYETLCGEPPLVGNDAMATIYMHVHSWPTPMSEIITKPKLPSYLEAIIVKTLQKEPEKRFESVRELLDELECFYNEETKSKMPKWLNKFSRIVGSKG